MECSVTEIIRNAVVANRVDTKYDVQLVKNFIKSIRDCKNLFESTSEIDSQNNNGFVVDIETVERILTKYENADAIIDNENIIHENEDLITSRMYDKIGVLLVMFDGNPYVLLEMIILGLLTHNTMIFNYDGYMRGTNGFILTLVQSILEKEGIDKNKFQEVIDLGNEELLNSFKSINKTVVIGDSTFINNCVRDCKNEVLVSGYNNFDIYVDSLVHKDVIDRVLATGLNINLYINDELDFGESDDNAVIVNDIEEAITYINYNSSRYSSAIFTDSNENASLFMRRINSKYIMVNASPTLERALDITQEDLLRFKNIAIPNMYKLDGTRIEIKG